MIGLFFEISQEWIVDYNQRTLMNEVGCTGIGLHTGEKVKIHLRPAPANSGIKFVRTDLKGHPEVEVRFDNVFDTTLATTIGTNGCKVSTIEHLMAAFFGLGIDNAVVELDGPEVPIMDGSAAPFVFLIKSGGVREQKSPKQFIIIKKPFKVDDGNRSVCIYPSKELKITYMIDFQHPLLRNQQYELTFSGRDFIREISTARTFGFMKDVETLKKNGFARGGSLDNAVVIDDFRIINEDGLRFDDEFVRHKILDFIGDISIVGSPIIGHFVIKKSGHFLNQHMLRKLMESKKHWKVMTFKTLEECSKTNVTIPAFGTLQPVTA
jgi:UDP-3-O-[3-hydroxymyristoyl] N-acetylglucosamine deacetylase